MRISRLMPVPACAAWLAIAATGQPAFAQPVGDQMCGDGTTFTVQLPGDGRDIDDSEGFFRVIDAPLPPPDSVTLPNGCSIYAFFVSGYANNRYFHDWTFYKTAEFVARHNGYVHFSWWNNLLKEYLAGPLHPRNITVRRLFGLLDDVVIAPGPANPNSITSWLSFAPDFIDLPKANPDEDYQFQQDAALVIRAIREHNPGALIVVVGHSMGGNAVARLGMNRDLDIDLLAPIDPVGNRDKPRAVPGERSYNWTRWRVSHEFRGYRQWDCERNGIGLCRDFDPRLLHTKFRCRLGPFLSTRPLLPTLAPVACPRPLYVDPGTPLGLGSNIRRLYHRWQHEFFWPVDFLTTERFTYPQPLSSTVLGPNFQQPVATCAAGVDPTDPQVACDATDGHGEVLGYRGPRGEDLLGVQITDYVPFTVPRRRALLIELAGSSGDWAHRPVNPDLCLVCDGMIDVIQDLLDETPGPPVDLTGPVVVAEVTPGPNDFGWNNEDVVIALTARDERNGSGVRDIVTALSGAQPGGGTAAGDSATETVVEDGSTSLEYYATDLAGNIGDVGVVDVRIDRTPPTITANADPPANPGGWHRGDVSVSFEAGDALSGLTDAPAGPIVVSAEGAGVDIVGVAEDRAGNAASASVTINLDKTAPAIEILTPGTGADYLLNASVATAYSCLDSLSGVASCTGPIASGAMLGTDVPGERDFLVQATDIADNTAGRLVRYAVRFGFEGFLPPLTPAGGRLRAKAGRTIPVKWRLFDAHRAPVSVPGAITSITTAPAACEGTEETGPAEPASGSVHYDAETGSFVFPWATDAAWSGCRVLDVQLSDGTTHRGRVTFQARPGRED